MSKISDTNEKAREAAAELDEIRARASDADKNAALAAADASAIASKVAEARDLLGTDLDAFLSELTSAKRKVDSDPELKSIFRDRFGAVQLNKLRCEVIVIGDQELSAEDVADISAFLDACELPPAEAGNAVRAYAHYMHLVMRNIGTWSWQHFFTQQMGGSAYKRDPMSATPFRDPGSPPKLTSLQRD